MAKRTKTKLEHWVECRLRHCKDVRRIEVPATVLQAAQFAVPSINIQGIWSRFHHWVSLHVFLQVNLDFNTSHIISQNLQRPSAQCFVTAQRKIFSLMENGSFPRFLQSKHYHCLFQDGSGGKQKVFKTKSAGDIIQRDHKPVILSWVSAWNMITTWTVELMSTSCWQTLWLHNPFLCALRPAISLNAVALFCGVKLKKESAWVSRRFNLVSQLKSGAFSRDSQSHQCEIRSKRKWGVGLKFWVLCELHDKYFLRSLTPWSLFCLFTIRTKKTLLFVSHIEKCLARFKIRLPSSGGKTDNGK